MDNTTNEELKDIKSFVEQLLAEEKIEDYSRIEETLRSGEWNTAIKPGKDETIYFRLSDKGEFGYTSLGISSTIEGIEEKLKRANEYGGLPHQLNEAHITINGIIYLKPPYDDIGTLLGK